MLFSSLFLFRVLFTTVTGRLETDPYRVKLVLELGRYRNIIPIEDRFSNRDR